ncbi:interferon-induced protein 44-like [Enhydra lutris kenyoni]|uniref:Interferon-induced protein 44 n=1 Tax=Enhydra lutris kenyoni TaxID=391180 RepID=A0A2Y9IX68_ENHLU|nr:interferon-induced protein 44-like [Enhydra lutris kenyoni]
MAMATRLTAMQEKKLQNYFGGKRFTLLYKASVHEFSGYNFLKRCSGQGPTLMVIYGGCYVWGAYIRMNFKRDDTVPIVLFAFQENEISECDVGACSPPTFLNEYGLRWNNSSGFLLDLSEKKVTVDLDAAKKLGLPQNQPISFEECEVFRCEDLLDKRIMKGITQLHERLLDDMRTYSSYGGLVHQIRILLLGPTGAGKSSFFNSVKSVFRGHVTHQALVGSDTTGVSGKYRTYSIKDQRSGNALPFILCDSMGLGEKEEGLCMDDIVYILKGHISDRYQFNSSKPITPVHSNYIDNPLLKDRIHCVALVFDINTVEHLSRDMMAKIKKIRRELIKCGVAHVVLLTHVDSVDLISRGDLGDIYKCMLVKPKLETVHRELGFALSDILVISNYTSEWELDPVKDVLILSALRQMLWAADDFLEDLPPEETEIKEEEPPTV